MSLRTLVSSLMVCAMLGAAPPAPAEPLSRAQAVSRALAANPAVQRSLEELAILQGRKREVLADALPQLTLTGSATRYRDPSLLNSSSFDAFPPELREALRPLPANLYEGTLHLGQTLFSFRLGRAIRAAQLASELGREQHERARQLVALEAVRAYNDYLLSLEKVRVAERAVGQKQVHLDTARSRRAAGVATDLDVLRSEVDLANQRAQLVRTRGLAELSRATLNAVMVRPIDAAIEPSDDLGFVPLAATLEETLRQAWAHRPDLRGAGMMEAFREQWIGVAQADSRPRLDLNAAWGYSVRRPRNFFESSFERWTASVVLKVPLFDGFRSAGLVAQARAERRKATQDRIELENRIRLEASDALDRLRVAGAVLESAELNVTQAAKALQMTQANYSHGAATTLDVLDAQAALTVAESIRLEALYDHANARATVRHVMGLDPLDERPKAGS